MKTDPYDARRKDSHVSVNFSDAQIVRKFAKGVFLTYFKVTIFFDITYLGNSTI